MRRHPRPTAPHHCPRAVRPQAAGSGQPALHRPPPNQLWVADLTYIRTWSGWVYVAFVLDVYSRMIVGWQLATHMRTDFPLDALEMALWRQGLKKGSSLIHHIDRGSPYVSIRYGERLLEAGAFARVQSQLHIRASTGTWHVKRRTRIPYLFRGRILCGVCKRRMQGQWSHGSAYYRCRLPHPAPPQRLPARILADRTARRMDRETLLPSPHRGDHRPHRRSSGRKNSPCTLSVHDGVSPDRDPSPGSFDDRI
ncbi:DDE-type integrase/transposase/recombinase [Streptomyces sp. 3N207]|uniref:DDE-type integrase/transposase/recombinase n=1 Tax=Streptomyces sp. 3N207 TaxID=3457417 RepID=UPI003FCF3398